MCRKTFSSVFETFMTIDDQLVTYGKQSIEDILFWQQMDLEQYEDEEKAGT
jgi:hypothetical protein